MTHTWNLYLCYHRCPQCELIFESRKPYEKEGKKLVKNLTCPQCAHLYRLEKVAPRHTHLFGSTPKPEFDWSEK